MVKTTQFHNFAKVLLANENIFKNKNRILVVAKISVQRTGKQIPKNINNGKWYQIVIDNSPKRK